MVPLVFLVNLFLLVDGQAQVYFYMTQQAKMPGKAYNSVTDPNRFSSVEDMDQICQDEAAATFAAVGGPTFEAHWEFQAFACSGKQPNLKSRFPSFSAPTHTPVPLKNLNDQTIAPSMAEFFAAPGCGVGDGSTCWDFTTNPLDADLAPRPATYPAVDQTGLVVTDNTPDRYFWHACDENGDLIQSATYPPTKASCVDWTSADSSHEVWRLRSWEWFECRGRATTKPRSSYLHSLPFSRDCWRTLARAPPRS
jgi:hypothetical protein